MRQKRTIDPKMSVLDVVGTHRQTEAIFKAYDEKAGACICCQALFDPLDEVARRYGLDLEELLADLEASIIEDGKPSCESGGRDPRTG